jgi:hypothetical protein
MKRLQVRPSGGLFLISSLCEMFIQHCSIERESCYDECHFICMPQHPSMSMFTSFPTLCMINVIDSGKVESFKTMTITNVATPLLQYIQCSNFNDDESVRLCKTWLNVNQNFSKGIDKKYDNFYVSIIDVFNKAKVCNMSTMITRIEVVN